MSQQKIKDHYEIALNLIKIGQISKAEHELFNKMPRHLYDDSLDLLDNRNLKMKNHELKSLIRKVHELLMPEEGIEDKESDITDNNLTIF